MRWISDRALERLRAVSPLPDLSGTRYRLLEPIGRGGMGAVYLAEDTVLGRRVALKVLDAPDPSGDLANRLMREARVLARLEHPGIVPIHDVGELRDGRLFYTMKLVRGHRLDHYLREAPSLTDRLRVFLRICEAVAFAHDRDVLHRDLKPQNIMVGAFGEVLVMDWGVAKVLRESLPGEDGETLAQEAGLEPAGVDSGSAVDGVEPTAHGVVLGTPGYMAPEQARGEVGALDERADVYSLGAVLRFLLAGYPASSDLTTAALAGAAPGSPEDGQVEIPKRLAAVVSKAMAAEPTSRYAGAQELADDVGRFLEGRAVAALPESVWTRTGRFLVQHRVAVILILVYVVVRALVLAFLGR